jgi:ribosome biogenesis protein ERB1
MHHCLLAAVGKCAVILATGTGGAQDSEITDALLAELTKGGNVSNPKAEKAVKWIPLNESDETSVSALAKNTGLIVALVTQKEVASVRWHRKEDCFVTVSPKAGTSAVLIHQLSKRNSQQPFRKAKREAQLACFHPNKQFLFVASQHKQHVRVYHLFVEVHHGEL